MKSLLALLLTVITACAIARPGHPRVRRFRHGPLPLYNDALSDLISPVESNLVGRESVKLFNLITPTESVPKRREILNYRYPEYLSAFMGGRAPYLPPKAPELSILNKEIEQIGNMPEKSPILYKPGSDMPWSSHDYTHIMRHDVPYTQKAKYPNGGNIHLQTPSSPNIFRNVEFYQRNPATIFSRPREAHLEPDHAYEKQQKERKKFALTPMDQEYFAPTETGYSHKTLIRPTEPERGEQEKIDNLRRDTRQNPLGHTKSLVAEDLEELRTGLNSDNLGSTAKPKNMDVFGTYISRDKVFVVAVSAGVAAAIILGISLFTIGFYVLVKRAKAAASVDYPAYGVTGPTLDTSGDRRLAHSAQMYHYQHQKQQIIAMERSTTEGNGSVSDPESEEENLEGDYTVYECPGFATTGAMEVRNPLFDEPTPATPGRMQVVPAQPKE